MNYAVIVIKAITVDLKCNPEHKIYENLQDFYDINDQKAFGYMKGRDLSNVFTNGSSKQH